MNGRLAQMDRVQASEAWGRGFESHAARQIDKKREREDIRSLFFIRVAAIEMAR